MIYIEIVGLDGAGKSKLARSLRYELGDRARLLHVSMADFTYDLARVVSTSESVSPVTRALGYMAAHSEVYDIISSDLERIDYLIGDRGYACFYAYQHQCPAKVIDQLWTLAMRFLFPDLLVFIDTPVWLCQERIVRRHNPSVIDKKPASFHKSVRERYFAFIESYQRGQTLILDGTRHTNILRRKVLKVIKNLSPVEV